MDRNTQYTENRSAHATAFDVVAEALLLLDEQGLVRDANPAFCGLLMREREGLRGVPLVDLLAPGNGEGVPRWLPEEATTSEHALLRADGGQVPVALTVHPSVDRGYLVVIRPRGDPPVGEGKSELRALMDAIPDAFFTLRPDGTMLSYHAPVGSGVGPRAREFVGRTLADVLPEQAVAQCMDAIGRALSTGDQQQLDIEYDDEGVPRLFDARVAAVGPNAALALVRDVTERRGLEERLRKIAAQVPGVVYQYKQNPDGTSCFPYASDGIRKIYRVAPEEVVADATPVFNVLHPDDYDRVAASIARSAETLTQWQCEYRVRFPDGGEQLLFGNSTPEALPDGSVVWHGFITDVTAQRRSQEQLRQSEERFRGYFEIGQVGMAIGDAEGRWLEVNDRLCAMLGYTRAELLHIGWNQVTHPDDVEKSSHWFQEMRSGRIEHYTFDKRFLRKDGSVLTANIAVKAVRDDHGALDHTLASFTDLTDRIRAEQERLSLERRLLHAQKLESLGVMAGGIAHDFNNLLTAIMGNLELASLDLPQDSRALATIDRATQASRRAADLTRQMLAYSGKANFVVRDLDLNALVEENAHLFRAAIPKSVVFQFALDPAIPPMRGDPGQIQQIIMNLITNAAEAMGEREGTVTLRTGRVERSAAELADSRLDDKPPPGQFLALEVIDTGCGMDAATLDRLFDPFFTTKFTGRGLGMSAVLGIIRAHRGAITVRSAPGTGTAIEVLFPATAPVVAGGGPAESAPVGGQAPCLSRHEAVLIVDDEPMVLALCKDFVAHLGFTVLTATDGQEALGVLEARHAEVRCVILDYAMPRMHGLAALEEIRRRWPTIRVILSSGYSDVVAVRDPSGPAPDAFMEKPYTYQALREILARMLRAAP